MAHLPLEPPPGGHKVPRGSGHHRSQQPPFHLLHRHFTPFHSLFLSFSHMETYGIEGSQRQSLTCCHPSIVRGREGDTLPLGKSQASSTPSSMGRTSAAPLLPVVQPESPVHRGGLSDQATVTKAMDARLEAETCLLVALLLSEVGGF